MTTGDLTICAVICLVLFCVALILGDIAEVLREIRDELIKEKP